MYELLSCNLESGCIVIEILSTFPCTRWVSSRLFMGDSVIRKTDSKNGSMRKKNTGKKLPQRHKKAGIGCNKRLSSLPLERGCGCGTAAFVGSVLC